MYTNILVPVSFDEERDAKRAIDVARRLATTDARITLLHVIEQLPTYALTSAATGYLEEARRTVTQELEALASGIENCASVVVEGHAAREILEYTRDHGSDCIVVASHRPGMQDYFLGSTAAHVVRHAGCSVHVVR
jgi:nucleotide-binding universal stress UspA family protein